GTPGGLAPPSPHTPRRHRSPAADQARSLLGTPSASALVNYSRFVDETGGVIGVDYLSRGQTTVLAMEPGTFRRVAGQGRPVSAAERWGSRRPAFIVRVGGDDRRVVLVDETGQRAETEPALFWRRVRRDLGAARIPLNTEIWLLNEDAGTAVNELSLMR